MGIYLCRSISFSFLMEKVVKGSFFAWDLLLSQSKDSPLSHFCEVVGL